MEWRSGVRAEGQFVLESTSRSCGMQDKLVSLFKGNQECTKGIGGWFSVGTLLKHMEIFGEGTE